MVESLGIPYRSISPKPKFHRNLGKLSPRPLACERGVGGVVGERAPKRTVYDGYTTNSHDDLTPARNE
ncbi:unnamed protein product [Penicillium bialowiezense]